MQWSIKTRLILGFGLAAAMLAVGTITAYWAQTQSQATEQTVAHYGHVGTDVEHVRACVLGITVHQRTFMINADQGELDLITALRVDYNQVLDRLVAESAADSDITSHLQQIRDILRQRKAVIDELNTTRKTQGLEATQALFTSGQDVRLLAQMEERFAAIKERATTMLAQSEAENLRLQHTILTLESVGLLVALGILAFFAMAIIRSISRNVQLSVDLVTSMAEKDLSQPDGQPFTQDELATAIAAINTMKQSMATALSEVAHSSQSVAQAGVAIRTASEEIASTTHQEQDAITRFASSLTEMNAATQNVAEHAELASAAASTAVDTANQGQQVVEATQQAMNRIHESVRSASTDITALGEVTGSIGEVVRIIQDIAGQTNLLALNAAIEAARAGEQGKGFAVVAQEVRSLAERTARFTGEIAAKIESVQQGATRAVASMRQGEEVVEEGVAQFEQVAASLNAIRNSIESAQQGMAMIAAATTQQSSETSGLTESINVISQEVQHIATKVGENSQSSVELERLSTELQHVVHAFRLPQGHSSRLSY